MEKKRLYRYRNLTGGLIAAFAMVVALVFCFSIIRNINRQMNESATANLLNTTRVIEGNLENYIEKDLESLNVVGELYKNEHPLDGEELAALCETMGFERIGIIQAAGDGTDVTDKTSKVSELPWYHQWKPEETGYSDAYYGESGRLQTTFWVPIYKNQKLIGTVFGDVLLSRYYSANVFTFYEGAGRTYLFDSSDGSWILKSLGSDGLSTNQDDIYSLLSHSGNQEKDIGAFRQAIEAKQTGTAVFDFNGEDSYICFMPLSSSADWYVATVIARDVLLKESTQVRRMIQMIFMVFCAALLFFVVVLLQWQNRKTKIREANYREALFANISSNIDSAFLIYEKSSRKPVFVSDNVKRLLGLERGWLKADAGNLFDWCGIEQTDIQRTAFLNGELETPAAREVCVENEMGEKARYIRLELIPADLGQEIAVLTDITGDKDIQNSLSEAMQHAEAASRAKNDFLSAMSHDIRTPMNGIIGMTAIAATHLDDRNRVRDCLDKISDASSHLLNMINEILDMSRIESGKLELAEEPFNLAQLLQEVLTMNYPGIQQKSHEIKVHIHSMEHEQVIGDPMRLQRITANLISNAIKYTPDHGTIRLSLQEKEPVIKGYGCYELTVEDNGIGMSREFQQKLFLPFEREDDVRLKKIQGTGLGMSIVKNIVTLMMGDIQVESEKNKGTAFRVTVNLKLDENRDILSRKLDKLPVLVVDDDWIACETVTSMLSDIGMTGEWVDNGALAVSRVSERHRRGEDYMAVLLDWKMPGVDGVETARRIRAKVDSKVPIIILTAYDWSEIEDEARAAGVDAFLSKPIYKTKLMHQMLTIAEGFEDSQEPPEKTEERKITAGRRVLLVEDNPLNREIAVEILQEQKLNIDTAENGAEAVRRFADSRPGTYDLILMDIQMPIMNGYEATRAIRAMERQDSSVPIIAMTANAFAQDVQMARAAGMNEHLSKPIAVERLIQVLRNFLTENTENQKEISEDEKRN